MAAPLLPIVTDPVFKLVYQGVALEQTTINVLYYKQDPSAGPVLGLADVVDSVTVPLMAKWLPFASSSWNLVRVLASVFTDPTIGTLVVDFDPATYVGGIASPPDTTFVAASIRKKTAFGGRRGHGNWRLGGIPDSKVEGNAWVAGYDTLLENWALEAKDVQVSTANPLVNLVPMLCTRTLNLEGAATVRGAQITAVSVNAVPTTQRSRRPRPVS